MSELLQLFYTSCKKGLSSSSGAQTYSMSEGLSNQERQEIEKIGLYLPPADLPVEPSAEQIEDQFPVAFTFFRLSTGRYGVSQSKYIGTDYSGRWGNYFNHALVMKEGAFPVYPIQLYQSPVFRNGLTQEEETVKKTPPPLPTLPLDQLMDNPSFSIDDVSSFLKDNPNKTVLENMMDALLDRDRAGRRLVLCDNWSNVPFWLAALQASFNVDTAHELTFTTYTMDPQNWDFLVAATSATGGRYSADDYQRDPRYFLFDLVENHISSLDRHSSFGRAVGRWLPKQPGEIKSFQEFATRFSLNHISPEIDAVWNLYQLLNVGLESMSAGDIISALEFADVHPESFVLKALADKIEAVISFIGPELNPDHVLPIAKLLFRITERSQNKALIDLAYGFVFDFIDRQVLDSNPPDREAVFRLNDEILLFRRDRAREFVKKATAGKRLAALAERLGPEPDPFKAGIFFELAVDNLGAVGINWDRAREDPDFDTFFRLCLHGANRNQEAIRETLKGISPHVSFFAPAVAELAGNVSPESNLDSAAEILKQVTSQKPGDWSLQIRKDLATLGQGRLLFAEFQKFMETAKDPSATFWDYRKRIFAALPAYQDEYFSEAAMFLLNMLKPRQRSSECRRLFSLAAHLKDDHLHQIVEWFEKELSLGSVDMEDRNDLALCGEIKSKRGIRTSPDTTGLLLFGIQLLEKKPKNNNFVDLAPQPFPVLTGLDKKHYKEYLDWVIPLAIPFVSSSKGHDILLGSLAMPGQEKLLISRFVKHFESYLKNERDPLAGLFPFFYFILKPVVNPDTLTSVEARSLLLNEAPGIAAGIPAGHIKKISANVDKNDNLDRALWKDIVTRMEEKKDRSFSSRIKKLFGLGR